MRTSPRAGLFLLAALALLVAVACGPPSDPEIVALTYVRATSGGDPDTAVTLLDLERMTARVEEEVVVVNSSDGETFLEDSIETLVWGVFREARPADYVYDATPAEIDGDRARVPVTRTAADQTSETIVVHLRNTDEGWRVSGKSLDSLIRVVVQRLQEKY